MSRNEELETYKQAVWDFLLEHSDITKGGALFVKFHTDGRQNFENRIKGRWKYGYHRTDVRAREAMHLDVKARHQEAKKQKKERYILGRAERIKAFKKIERRKAIRANISKALAMVKSIIF